LLRGGIGIRRQLFLQMPLLLKPAPACSGSGSEGIETVVPTRSQRGRKQPRPGHSPLRGSRMSDHAMLWPAFGLVALTAVVWFRMFFERVGQIRSQRIRLREIATSAQLSQRLTDSRAADNFRNLFEVPVLFYAALLVAHSAQLASPTLLALAWVFVSLRVVHSAIHCSYNRVRHRFFAYVAGGIVLWGMWVMLGWQLWKA
jgi:hypothetical protein